MEAKENNIKNMEYKNETMDIISSKIIPAI